MALISLFIAIVAAQAKTTAKVRNVDTEVIEAAMLQFFTPKIEEDWQSADWREGDAALLFGQLSSKVRETAAPVLHEWIERESSSESDPKYGKRAAEMLSPLRELHKEVAGKGGTFRPPAIVPLATMGFGPKVLVGEPKFTWRRTWYDTPLPGGRPGRPRVVAWLTPPSYSGDGQVAVLTMHTLWSMHSADVMIAVRRNGTGWKRVFARTRFYV